MISRVCMLHRSYLLRSLLPSFTSRCFTKFPSSLALASPQFRFRQQCFASNDTSEADLDGVDEVEKAVVKLRIDEFVEQQKRQPSEEEMALIKITTNLYLSLCTVLSERLNFTLTEEVERSIRDYIEDERVIRYVARETELTLFLAKRWERQTGRAPDEMSMRQIRDECEKKLKEETEVFPAFEAALDELVNKVKKLNEETDKRLREEVVKRKKEHEVKEQVIAKYLTQIRMMVESKKKVEPSVDDMQKSVVELISVHLHKAIFEIMFSGLDQIIQANAPIEVDESSDASQIEEITRDWVSKFVTPLNICPHASGHPIYVQVGGRSIFKDYHPTDEHIPKSMSDIDLSVIKNQLELVWAAGERLRLLLEDAEEDETPSMLLVLPYLKVLHWVGFTSFTDACNIGLRAAGLHAQCFHPAVIFSSEPANPVNFRKRSPWPTIHIMKYDSFRSSSWQGKSNDEFAVHLNDANQRKLKKMGIDKVRAEFSAFMEKGTLFTEGATRPVSRKRRVNARQRNAKSSTEHAD